MLSQKEKDTVNLELTNQILVDAINETRKISFELMPPVLRDYGLSVSLQTLAQKIVGDSLRVNIQVDLKDRLGEELEISIYRIVQEAMNNVVKHAEATEASIDIRKSDSVVRIKVSDNGKGFPPKETEKHPAGIGLQTIRNRVRLLDGEVKFGSGAKGAVVDIRLPIKR